MKRLLGLTMAGTLMVGLAGPAYAYHDYQGRDRHGGYSYSDGDDDGNCDWNGDCGGNYYRHDYSNHDRNRNRNRDRGAFSPGPFRDSPVIICLPYSCNSGGEQSGGNRQNPPPRQGPGGNGDQGDG